MTASTVNAVKVADQVATVDLTSQVRSADAQHRLMLKGQLDQTLTGPLQTVVSISSVVVTVEQQAFDMQPAAASDARGVSGSPGELQQPPEVENSPVALDAKGAVVRLVNGSAVPVSGLASLTSPGNAYPATESGGDAYAVLSADRTRLTYATISGSAQLLMSGHDLVAPSFDPFGWVWSAQQDSWGQLLAGQPSGVVRVAAAWLDGAQLLSIRISREGARAVLVLNRPGKGSEVVVCSVVRDPSGRPTALGPPLQVFADAQDPTSAAWVDPTHVVVLARRGGQPTATWIVEIGGRGDNDVVPALAVQAVSVTAGNDEYEMYATTATGAVLSRVGGGWQEVKGVRWATLPG
jgi:Lipoprotein LpqB beta-propeller domain